MARPNPTFLTGLAGAICLSSALVSTGCSSEAEGAREVRAPSLVETEIFSEVTQQAGIDHRHSKPELDSAISNIMSWMASVGAAVAVSDYDRDGWVDLFATNSRKGEPNYLYRNRGDGTFEEVGAQAGLADANGEQGTSMDAVWGDVDNDGWPDLYLVRWGRDSLYRNLGDGTFEEVTAERFRRADGSAGTDWANGNAAVFLDHDRDGRLDIYVGNYFKEVDLWNLEDTRIMHDDFETSRNGGRNFFYHQQADGTFREKAVELGLDDAGWTLAVGAGDLDADGIPDLYCANDFGPDQLFLGNDDHTFANVTEEAMGFDTKKGMNVDFGDFNNDGWLDVYVANITTAEYLQEGNMLWFNQGPGDGRRVRLTDISLESGTYDGGWGWGAKFFDYDNDSDLDIIAVNGFISGSEESYWYDLASWTVVGEDSTDTRNWPPIGDRSFSGYEKTRVWRNDGLYSFTEHAAALGLDSDRDGRGIAVLDYDNDGDLDVFIANQGQPPQLFANQPQQRRHWLGISLETDPALPDVNRDGLGTRVTLQVGGKLLVREREGGNGFSGQSDPRLHFGLGSAESIDLVEVRWPDGGYQYLEDVTVDQYVTLRQDPSRYAKDFKIDLAAPSWTPTTSTQTAEALVRQASPEEIEAQLAELEGQLRSQPPDHALLSLYRKRAADLGEHDRGIEFLTALAETPTVSASEEASAQVGVHLSLAYVDKIPTCGGLAAIVCKGSLAKKGLDAADRVLEQAPDSWLAFYARGMNHLHWPRALRHSEDAAQDLARCVELEPSASEYQERVHVALGQAWAKAGEYRKAREAWRRGLDHFPGSEELESHLAIESDDELLAYVEDLRSLQSPLDTDVSFFPLAL